MSKLVCKVPNDENIDIYCEVKLNTTINHGNKTLLTKYIQIIQGG